MTGFAEKLDANIASLVRSLKILIILICLTIAALAVSAVSEPFCEAIAIKSILGVVFALIGASTLAGMFPRRIRHR